MTDFIIVALTSLVAACVPLLVKTVLRHLPPKSPQIEIVTPTGKKFTVHRSDLTVEKVQEIIHSHT